MLKSRMAKKKKVINLAKEDIFYREKGRDIKIISFNPNTMEVEVIISSKNEDKHLTCLPLAHLPKDIKKIVKPL